MLVFKGKEWGQNETMSVRLLLVLMRPALAGTHVGPRILKISVWNRRLLNLRTASSHFGRELTGLGEAILQRPQP